MAWAAAGAGFGAGRYERELCEAIVKSTLHLAAGRTVTDLRGRVGGYPADPDQIVRCFHAASNGTVAEHPRLQLVLDSPAVRCLSCGNETATGYALALLACRRCGSFDLETTGTEQVVLESITFGGAHGGRHDEFLLFQGAQAAIDLPALDAGDTQPGEALNEVISVARPLADEQKQGKPGAGCCTWCFFRWEPPVLIRHRVGVGPLPPAKGINGGSCQMYVPMRMRAALAGSCIATRYSTTTRGWRIWRRRWTEACSATMASPRSARTA